MPAVAAPPGYGHMGHPMHASMHFQAAGLSMTEASPYPYAVQAVSPMVYAHPGQAMYNPNMHMYHSPTPGSVSAAGSMPLGMPQAYSGYPMQGGGWLAAAQARYS